MSGTTIEVNNLDKDYTHHTLIADAVAEVLGVGTDVVFHALKNK
jgi:hypothetical protein